jgi:hypothetical protein
MTAFLTALLILGADLPSKPRLVGSVRVSTFTGLPDVLGVSGTLRLIPYVELEGGASAFVFSQGGTRVPAIAGSSRIGVTNRTTAPRCGSRRSSGSSRSR